MEKIVQIIGDTAVGGLGGYLDPIDRSFSAVVMQQGKELLSKELNLSTQIQNYTRAEIIRSMAPSGVLDMLFTFTAGTKSLTTGDNLISGSGSVYSASALNSFQIKNFTALVHGFKVDINNGVVGNLALEVALNAPPSSGMREDLVFLEKWSEEVAPTGNDEGTSSSVYISGGVASSTYTNDIQDSGVGHETTVRVQERWRIRVVDGVDFTTYPEGVNDVGVHAQGGAGAPNATYHFANIGSEKGDYGLYRAGAGDETSCTALKCIDGYIYAIPLFKVLRRNTTAFSYLNPRGASAYPAVSTRPDGLWNNVIDERDVVPIAHKVSLVGFDNRLLLEEGFDKLLRGELKTKYKKEQWKDYLGANDVGLDADVKLLLRFDALTTNNLCPAFTFGGTVAQGADGTATLSAAEYALVTAGDIYYCLSVDRQIRIKSKDGTNTVTYTNVSSGASTVTTMHNGVWDLRGNFDGLDGSSTVIPVTSLTGTGTMPAFSQGVNGSSLCLPALNKSISWTIGSSINTGTIEFVAFGDDLKTMTGTVVVASGITVIINASHQIYLSLAGTTTSPVSLLTYVQPGMNKIKITTTGTSHILYINDVALGTYTTSATTASSVVTLGNTGGSYAGRIDQLRISGIVRTVDAQLYADFVLNKASISSAPDGLRYIFSDALTSQPTISSLTSSQKSIGTQSGIWTNTDAIQVRSGYTDAVVSGLVDAGTGVSKVVKASTSSTVIYLDSVSGFANSDTISIFSPTTLIATTATLAASGAVDASGSSLTLTSSVTTAVGDLIVEITSASSQPTVSWEYSESGTLPVQTGGSTTIVLPAASSTEDDFYGGGSGNNMVITITGGTGVGQVRTITDYVGSTKVATVAALSPQPTNTSTYSISKVFTTTGVTWTGLGTQKAKCTIGAVTGSKDGLTNCNQYMNNVAGNAGFNLVVNYNIIYPPGIGIANVPKINALKSISGSDYILRSAIVDSGGDFSRSVGVLCNPDTKQVQFYALKSKASRLNLLGYGDYKTVSMTAHSTTNGTYTWDATESAFKVITGSGNIAYMECSPAINLSARYYHISAEVKNGDASSAELFTLDGGADLAYIGDTITSTVAYTVCSGKVATTGTLILAPKVNASASSKFAYFKNLSIIEITEEEYLDAAWTPPTITTNSLLLGSPLYHSLVDNTPSKTDRLCLWYEKVSQQGVLPTGTYQVLYEDGIIYSTDLVTSNTRARSTYPNPTIELDNNYPTQVVSILTGDRFVRSDMSLESKNVGRNVVFSGGIEVLSSASMDQPKVCFKPYLVKQNNEISMIVLSNVITDTTVGLSATDQIVRKYKLLEGNYAR